MNIQCLRNSLFAGAAGLLLMNTVQAGIPVWTFAPLPDYPSSVSVGLSETATIKYLVTNQSYKPHTLQMKPIKGIVSSGCTAPLTHHQSCTLILTVTGSALEGDVFGGPVLCDQSNPNQCYQPSDANSLAITLVKTPPAQQYTVTSSPGSNGTLSPSGPQIVKAGARLTFTATPDLGYGVNKWLVDGTPVQAGGTTYELVNITADHTVNVTFGTVTLTPNVSKLGLSVNCPATSTSSDCAQKNAELSGTPRQIKITNTGSVDATHVVVSHSGLPPDTSVSPSSCDTIAANGGQCVITITPGAIASSNASNTLCTTGVHPEGTVSVSENGGLSASVDTYVLSYGCIYQGGFIYSIDDTTSNTGSIGGKTAAITDTFPCSISPPIATPDWGGYGTDIGSSLHENNAQGANDGSANSAAIINALTINYSNPPYNGAAPIPLSDYAAGLCSTLSVNDAGSASCSAPSTCYSNWYLPAVCELGPFTSGAACTTSTNIQQQLFENTLIPSTTLGLVEACFYWSSTESTTPSPQVVAWVEYFSAGNSAQYGDFYKHTQLGVRCSRTLTV